MKPTVLIFYANNQGQTYLGELDKECKGIQQLLNAVERREYEVSLIPQTSISDIIKELNIPGRLVEIIHFSGHANDSVLLFGDNAADAAAFADKLKSVRTVKLAFLNGCSSKGQVRFFHDAGVPYVIATSRPVEDTKASWLANQFYNYLSLGRTVNAAFDEIQKDARLLKTDLSLVVNRGIGLAPTGQEPEELEWGLYALADSAEYKLPITLPAAGQTPQNGVRHTRLLSKMLVALKNQTSPISTKYKNTIATIELQGEPADKIMVRSLLEILPYPLGIRLQQINGIPQDDGDLSEYHRQLLYDYALFFETQLNLSTILLLSQIWQNKTAIDLSLQETFKPIRDFLTNNRLNHSLADYAVVIQKGIEILNTAGIDNIIPKIENVRDYLTSGAFGKACAFFDVNKNYFWSHIRLSQEEAVERCYASQEHIIGGLPYFSFVVENILTSVRDVDTINFRHVDKYFASSVSQLVAVSEDAGSNFMMNPSPMENKSILCFSKYDYDPSTPSINLFPFLLDRNVFIKQAATEIDLYLFLGFFSDEMITNLSIRKVGNPCFYFMSLKNPQKIWRFNDEDPSGSDLAHIDDVVAETYRQNHLLTNAGELNTYLSKFKTFFIAS
ncbi:CHAT domain-containing protein [Dyadobacter sp. SG02]|uniref:CHAT domain-containing protein n=1 Tax=Dyadobacter sp. SG02 TaxID=1855291 RepID=UPI0008B15244|nr:CHAT domain-containing protein [Dyadobacter sp. SG02]SEJ59789.1 CHAT domain-containing protein [Dyadobacter sp. SG02]